tara:strand:+ start:180 stop:335 length:156 start_codon:yes stop_codon:yes gene_type:complete
MQKRVKNLAAEEFWIEVMAVKDGGFSAKQGLNITIVNYLKIKTNFLQMMFG